MSKKMLIDATHVEETRVVVLDNGRLDEFDVDTSTKKQIKGNIYLAKVVRVEPSLQAAFVDYGGNKHGFLAFSEIHPDYYQIPVADREALKELISVKDEEEHKDEAEKVEEISRTEVETVSGNEGEETKVRRPSFFKKYKIQEVIKQGQVMLVQVVKEERGNKGAAMTTYLSLAGRFSVLMPNNGRGGGVSRKITNVKERKALRVIVDKLPIPEGMSVIIRTAGSGRTKTEIKRDYDYLIKTWMKIRENTLESLAPALIHEEGDIIKRSLRDVFTPDIEEIWVEGDKVFKSTKEFMKSLIPGQVKKIKQYKGEEPLFQHYQVENQLEAIHSNIAQLKSGGYLVIDQTEALVAVDVNSGRSTKERDIEETALRTNLETCDELARQLKLRDMAGLIVIDFIDMDEPKNNAAVESRLKEALKHDRARIQVGKISGFGLMEMSRQRLHSSFLESSYHVCPHCGGKGMVRLPESCATRTLYLLEEAAGRNTGNEIIMSLPVDVAAYVLNHKRRELSALEQKYSVTIQIMADSRLEKNGDYRLERVRADGEKVIIPPAPQPVKEKPAKPVKPAKPAKEAVVETGAEESVEVSAEGTEPAEGEPHISAKTARNRRRREWKKRKHAEWLARKQAHREAAEAAAAAENGGALTVVEDHLPAVVEDGHKAVVVAESEEHFTVVEQGHLEEETPKSARKYRNRRKRSDKVEKAQGAETAEAVVSEKTVTETKVPERKAQTKTEKTVKPEPAEVTETVVAEPKTEEKPKTRKGGWWNRLVK